MRNYQVKTKGAMFRVSSILIGLWATLSVQASVASNNLSTAGVAEFTAAYQAWDGSRFAAAADLFRRATTNSPANVTNFYWLGAAEFHRMLQLRSAPANRTNEAAAKAALDAAVDALTLAVKLDEHHAESHALLGTSYGMKINGNLIRGARFGPRVANHQELALKHGASNPRVHYLLGMGQFHTARKPAGWQAALQTLLKAEKLFEAEAKTTAAPLDPRWGQSSCLTFIARAWELLGQRKEAVKYFRKALAMHPADHLAKEGLKRASESN
jgi:tetratricopeptide (TPR) repeat protein